MSHRQPRAGGLRRRQRDDARPAGPPPQSRAEDGRDGVRPLRRFDGLRRACGTARAERDDAAAREAREEEESCTAVRAKEGGSAKGQAPHWSRRGLMRSIPKSAFGAGTSCT